LDISKINKQGYDLARKGDGNEVYDRYRTSVHAGCSQGFGPKKRNQNREKDNRPDSLEANVLSFDCRHSDIAGGQLGARAPGRINTLFQPFRNVFLSRSLD